jgi:hypothetical protein
MADFNTNPRTVATTITGDRGPENEVSQRIVADVEDTIHLYRPAATPLTVFTGKIRNKRTAHQYQYDYLTLDEYPRAVTSSAAYTALDTSIVLDAGLGDRVPTNAVLINTRTGESLFVSGVSTDTLTVVRGIGASGGVAGAAIEVGDQFIFTRAVFEDGTGKGSLKTNKAARDFNYTEIIKTTYGFTGRDIETEMYGGDDVEVTRKWAGIEHLKSIEFMMFFGARQLITTGTHYKTFSGGADYFLKSNVWNLSGDTEPKERAFVEFLEEAMRWGKGGFENGSAKKYLFASSRWLTVINGWATDRIRLVTSDKLLGIELMEYLSPHGTVYLVKTPILDQFHADRAYLFDLNHVRQVVHRGRGTKIMKNIQANDIDGMEEMYQSDVGSQFELEASHSLLKGLPL